MPSTKGPPQARERIASIDLLRGAVMVLMAIDHVRVFSGVSAGGATPALFFTRWVTHFCAPVFVFLAGTSAQLYGRRHLDLPRHLVTRGLWLVLLELTVVRVAWTFNFDFAQYELAGVLWVIGWSMVLLALLVRLRVPLALVGALGLAIVAGHDLLDPHIGAVTGRLGQDPVSWLWRIAYVGFYAGPIRFGANGPNLMVLYSLVPWIGVMACGFAFARVLTLERERRDRICLGLGLGAIALFLLLRGFDLYGDPRPWSAPPAQGSGAQLPAALRFLNTSKYPASFLFLLMTLGPSLALLPLLERARGRAAQAIAVFGRVPFFFYLLHLPVIHALAIAVSVARTGAVSPWLFANHPMGNPPAPPGYVWSLGLLYLVWAIALVLLYLACDWFAGVKARRSEWWLGYL